MDAFGLFELLEAFYKSECEVKKKSENIVKTATIPGNGREEDGFGAVYNRPVKVLLLF